MGKLGGNLQGKKIGMLVVAWEDHTAILPSSQVQM